MSQTTPAQALVSGTQIAIAPPSSSPFASVVLTNLSPYLLLLNLQGNTLWHAPFAERRYDIGPTATPIQVLPSTASGASIASGVGAQVQATWYAPGELIVGTWPVALTPSSPGLQRNVYISYPQACPAGGGFGVDTDIVGMFALPTTAWTFATISCGAAVGAAGSSTIRVSLLDGMLIHSLWEGTVFAGAGSVDHPMYNTTQPGKCYVNNTGTLDVYVSVLATLVSI